MFRHRRNGRLWAVVFSALFVNVCHGAERPRISSIEPRHPVAINGKQPLVLLGSHFDPKASVTLRDLDSREVFADRAILARTSERLELQVNFTNIPARWSVEVINPGGISSRQYRFRTEHSEDSEGDASSQTTEKEVPAPQRTAIGWAHPLANPIRVRPPWLARGSSYVDGKIHLGVDFRAKTYDPVYTIGPGTVVMIYGSNDCIVIRHYAERGPFVAVYGHIKPEVHLGQTVSAGQQIGTIAAYELGSHLHFGIAWGADAPEIDPGGAYGWGMMSEQYFDEKGIPNGLVDPLAWIETQAPGHSEGE